MMYYKIIDFAGDYKGGIEYSVGFGEDLTRIREQRPGFFLSLPNTMKRNILLILFLIGLRTAMGQTPGIISSVRYGGSGAERFTHIIRLNNGNYVCSGFTASAD